MRLISSILSACILLQITGCVPPGRRLLQMEVYQEDKLVLNTTFDVPDSSGTKAIWEYAGTRPFSSNEEVLQVQANTEDPLHADLNGAIHIKIFHTDDLVTEAELTELKLVREDVESARWFLSEDDVKKAIELIKDE